MPSTLKDSDFTEAEITCLREILRGGGQHLRRTTEFYKGLSQTKCNVPTITTFRDRYIAELKAARAVMSSDSTEYRQITSCIGNIKKVTDRMIQLLNSQDLTAKYIQALASAKSKLHAKPNLASFKAMVMKEKSK